MHKEYTNNTKHLLETFVTSCKLVEFPLMLMLGGGGEKGTPKLKGKRNPLKLDIFSHFLKLILRFYNKVNINNFPKLLKYITEIQ